MSTNVPPRWLHCPRKSKDLIVGKFLAFKTPLDHTFNNSLEDRHRFDIKMIFDSLSIKKISLKLWIDLTNTKRFYAEKELQKYECKYVKLSCLGRQGPPNEKQTNEFINLVDNFIKYHPLDAIGVHCTHGFNRTGFMIVSYLVEKMDYDLNTAIQTFAESRPPGIYKQGYIDALRQKYKYTDEILSISVIPDWEEDTDCLSKKDYESPIKNPKFAVDLPQIKAIMDWSIVSKLLKLIFQMLKWNKRGFPGGQPVSMNMENIELLSKKKYFFSWKADGTRYIMLIKDINEIYFLDRNNNIFQIQNLFFPQVNNLNEHIKNTLLDGELVIDTEGDLKVVRYYIYDIMYYNGVDVSEKNFDPDRLNLMKNYIIKPRHMCMTTGKIKKEHEPISIRNKDFWPLTSLEKVIKTDFLKKLHHELDGLIFQPSEEKYETDRCDSVLKWKPDIMNSIDFKLKIVIEEQIGKIPKKVGCLFVLGKENPFDTIELTKQLRQLNNCIIECTYENNKWKFMRQRTDKYLPNGINTAQSIMSSIQKPITKEYLLNYVKTQVLKFEFKEPASVQKF